MAFGHRGVPEYGAEGNTSVSEERRPLRHHRENSFKQQARLSTLLKKTKLFHRDRVHRGCYKQNLAQQPPTGKRDHSNPLATGTLSNYLALFWQSCRFPQHWGTYRSTMAFFSSLSKRSQELSHGLLRTPGPFNLVSFSAVAPPNSSLAA